MCAGQSVHYDMEDLLEQANEIQETLGRSYAVPDEIDEADLQAGAYARSLLVALIFIFLPELDALELEAEEEGPSYLSDLNKVPDFVDEAPVEVSEVSCSLFMAHVLQFAYMKQTPEQHEAVKTTAAA